MRKLSDSDRAKIRQMYAEGCSQRMIGQMYGISRQSVYDIVKEEDSSEKKDHIDGEQQVECPKCGSGECHVFDKRNKPYGIRRRRRCSSCGKRFGTVEVNVEDRKEIHHVVVIYKGEEQIWEGYKEWIKIQRKMG